MIQFVRFYYCYFFFTLNATKCSHKPAAILWHHEHGQHLRQKCDKCPKPIWGTGITQWLERWTRDWKVAGSNACRSGRKIFFSRVNFLCWLLFSYPFHPRVTAVARKRSRSSCQKCRWQVTAKHAYTMWLWMKSHCNLVHGWMVYTELAPKWQHFTWHQPCHNHRALLVHHFHGYAL